MLCDDPITHNQESIAILYVDKKIHNTKKDKILFFANCSTAVCHSFIQHKNMIFALFKFVVKDSSSK
jgi:hypothetical protein